MHNQAIANVNACLLPDSVKASGVANDKEKISWKGVTGAVGYQIRYKVTTASTYKTITVRGSDTTLVNLYSGTTYNFAVRTKCTGSTYSTWSKAATFTTSGPAACPKPINLTITSITENSAILGWSNTGASSYQVRYKINGTSVYNYLTATTNSVKLNNLTKGTTYVFYVEGICAADLKSPISAGKSFRTSGYACGFPTGITATSIMDNSAQIIWNEVPGTAGYQLVYTVYESGITKTIKTTSTSVTLSGLFPGTPYGVQIRTICGPGQNSAFSKWIYFNTSGKALCMPHSENVAGLTDHHAKMIWNAVPDAEYYVVRFRRQGNSKFTYDTIYSKNQYEVFNLRANTKYIWQVKTNCGAGNYTLRDTLKTMKTSPVRIGDNQLEQSISIYPNPSNGAVNIRTTSNHFNKLEITNILGESVYKGELLPDTDNSVDLTGKEKGIYLIILRNGEDTMVKRLILN